MLSGCHVCYHKLPVQLFSRNDEKSLLFGKVGCFMLHLRGCFFNPAALLKEDSDADLLSFRRSGKRLFSLETSRILKSGARFQNRILFYICLWLLGPQLPLETSGLGPCCCEGGQEGVWEGKGGCHLSTSEPFFLSHLTGLQSMNSISSDWGM